MAEDIVLIAAGALGALSAAPQKHRYANRHDQGKSVSVHRQPVNQTAHMKGQHILISRAIPLNRFHGNLCCYSEHLWFSATMIPPENIPSHSTFV
jgi:hypothetical protein